MASLTAFIIITLVIIAFKLVDLYEHHYRSRASPLPPLLPTTKPAAKIRLPSIQEAAATIPRPLPRAPPPTPTATTTSLAAASPRAIQDGTASSKVHDASSAAETPTINGKPVGAIGLGLMSFTWFRDTPIPLDDAVAALKTAYDSGMTLWNAAEFYGTPEYNSMTVLRAYFTRYPSHADRVVLVIKGAVNLETLAPEGDPRAVRRSLDNILRQLGGVKKIDLFNPARRDPNWPFGDTLGVIQREYVDTGKVGGIALSECRAETIHEAVRYARIGAAELELSMFSPDILRNGVAAACAEYDIPILAYSPMGKGMLAGKFRNPAQDLGAYSAWPRFQQDALQHNLKLADQVMELAERKGHASSSVAISWCQNLGRRRDMPTVIPIPGASSIAQVHMNSRLIAFTDEEMKDLNELAFNFDTAGERYPAFITMNT